MSRTDKDRPYRVRAADARPTIERHALRCERRGAGWRPPLPCDIDEPGIHNRCYRTGRREEWIRLWPACPSDLGYRDWTRPDRQRARLALRAATRDHNAHGATEIEPPVEQHRHRGRYDCW